MNHNPAQLEARVKRLESLLWKKTSGGSADIKGTIVNPSTIAADLDADSVGQTEWNYETANVTVSAGNPSGTATVTSGSIVIGWRATGNQDQFIDNISISGTTLTVTLAANATADNTFQIILLKS